MYIATILIIHLSIRDKKVVLKLNILSFWSVWGCSVFSYLHHVALRPPTRAMRFDDFLKVATLGFKCPSRIYDLYTLIKYSIDIFVIGISLCRGGGGSALHCWWGCAKKAQSAEVTVLSGTSEVTHPTTNDFKDLLFTTTNDQLWNDSYGICLLGLDVDRSPQMNTSIYTQRCVLNTRPKQIWTNDTIRHIPISETSSHPSAVLKSLFSNKGSTLWV